MKILMVCLGNICRSPLAEGILKDKATKNNLGWHIDSAGLINYHVGAAPYHLSQIVAEKNNIDISNQKARQISKKDIVDFDVIYAMSDDVYETILLKYCSTKEEEQKVKLILNEITPNNKSVPDPYGKSEDAFVKVYELLDDAWKNY